MEIEKIKSVDIKKFIVNIVILIFGFIIILIFILLALYYLTPNNYMLDNLDKNKFILEDQIEYAIKPNSIINIYNPNPNIYLKFPIQTNLIIKNIFKSQNIQVINDTELIKSKFNSEIFISNNSIEEKKIIVKFYLKK